METLKDPLGTDDGADPGVEHDHAARTTPDGEDRRIVKCSPDGDPASGETTVLPTFVGSRLLPSVNLDDRAALLDLVEEEPRP